MYFSESGSNKWSVALNFYGYNILIEKVEIMGNGPSGKWIALPRNWTNKYEWRGTLSYLNQTGDIYAGGDGFKVRLISVLGEVLSYDKNLSIPATDIVNQRFDLGFQFNSNFDIKNTFDKSTSCDWTGPQPNIYKDTIKSRKSNGKDWDDCIFNSTNCRTYFEGKFLVEWWLVHFSFKTQPNPSYAGTECDTSRCLEVINSVNGDVLLFGNSSKFNINYYKKVKFSAKLGSKATQATSKIGLTFDGCTGQVDFVITNKWSAYSADITGMSCGSTVFIKNLKFVFGSVADSIYLDDIYLDEIGAVGMISSGSTGINTYASYM